MSWHIQRWALVWASSHSRGLRMTGKPRPVVSGGCRGEQGTVCVHAFSAALASAARSSCVCWASMEYKRSRVQRHQLRAVGAPTCHPRATGPAKDSCRAPGAWGPRGRCPSVAEKPRIAPFCEPVNLARASPVELPAPSRSRGPETVTHLLASRHQRAWCCGPGGVISALHAHSRPCS